MSSTRSTNWSPRCPDSTLSRHAVARAGDAGSGQTDAHHPNTDGGNDDARMDDRHKWRYWPRPRPLSQERIEIAPYFLEYRFFQLRSGARPPAQCATLKIRRIQNRRVLIEHYTDPEISIVYCLNQSSWETSWRKKKSVRLRSA